METIFALAFLAWLISLGVLAALGRTPDTRDRRFTVGPLLEHTEGTWLDRVSLR
jgi:hypothetical protein